MTILIDKSSTTPIYKQIVEYVADKIKSGAFCAGELLPSMNELAITLDISKETVQKAYLMLRDRGFVEPHQGKGFFICDPDATDSPRVLVLFDKLSDGKQILFNSMVSTLGDKVQTVIRMHCQSLELLEFYLDEGLDKYDFYVITAHFPQDSESQKRLLKQLKRIPNRKLIMLDNYIPQMSGNFGAVYQDFDNDIYDGLSQGLEKLREIGHLSVVTMKSSLYHERICQAVRRFCAENGLSADFYNGVTPDMVRKDDVFLLLNGQIDSGLLDLVHAAEEKGLEIGSDIFIISYNDTLLNELVLGGLTTVSTDFAKMGEIAAQMILERKLCKIKNDFILNRRATF